MYCEMYFYCIACTKKLVKTYNVITNTLQYIAIHSNQLVHITAFYITKYIDIS